MIVLRLQTALLEQSCNNSVYYTRTDSGFGFKQALLYRASVFEISLKILQGRAAPEVKSRLYENTEVRYNNPTHPSPCYYVLFYSFARYPYDSYRSFG